MYRPTPTHFALLATLILGIILGFNSPLQKNKPHDFESCARLSDSVLLDNKTNCLTGYGEIFEKSSTKISEPTKKTETPVTSTPTVLPSASTLTATPIPYIPTKTPTPTPTPIRQDIYLYQPRHSMTRSYNDGSGKGTVVDSVAEGVPAATFSQYNRYWQSWVKTCFGFGIKEATNQRIGYTWTTDGTITIADGYYSAFENLAASNNFLICTDTPTSVGTHTVSIRLNPQKTIIENSTDNNSATLTYTILGDTTVPSFDFYGPFKESEGTCLYPSNVSDNQTVYNDLKIDVRMDSASWQPFNTMRTCIAGAIGETHTYSVRVTDEAGNSTEKSKQFTIL